MALRRHTGDTQKGNSDKTAVDILGRFCRPNLPSTHNYHGTCTPHNTLGMSTMKTSSPPAAAAASVAAIDAVTSSGAPTTPARPTSFGALLHDFYRIFRPDKLPHVGAIAAAHASQIDALIAHLEGKYAAPRFFSSYEYCFHSRYFDPRLALYNCNTVPPVLLARPLDNLHAAQALLPNSTVAAPAGVLHSDSVAQADRQYREGAGRPASLVDFWADGCIDGPLGALRQWYLSGSRVRVLLRPAAAGGGGGGDSGGGDGACASLWGALRACDKHWNLLLEEDGELGGGGNARRQTKQPPRQIIVVGEHVMAVSLAPTTRAVGAATERGGTTNSIR